METWRPNDFSNIICFTRIFYTKVLVPENTEHYNWFLCTLKTCQLIVGIHLQNIKVIVQFLNHFLHQSVFNTLFVKWNCIVSVICNKKDLCNSDKKLIINRDLSKPSQLFNHRAIETECIDNVLTNTYPHLIKLRLRIYK